MKTKEQAIIEAYKEYWNELPPEIQKYALQNDGWINSKEWIGDAGNTLIFKKLKCIPLDCMDNYHSTYCYFFRPKSLQGIEDNNGWIKIESEEDYNKLENGEYEWYNINTGKYEKGDLYSYGMFTHYKIIPKTIPKPPIY